jgi:hypothetical protein
MTKTEHINWCIDRAEFYLDRNELTEAIASFISDMTKHEDTIERIMIFVESELLFAHTNTVSEFRRWIKGFNVIGVQYSDIQE